MASVSLETLAAIAGQGGASPELDEIHFRQGHTTPELGRMQVSEQLNAQYPEAQDVAAADEA